MELTDWIGRIRSWLWRSSEGRNRESSVNRWTRDTLDEERAASLRRLEGHLGYRFHHIQWLDQALTHKSFTHESSPLQPVPPGGNGNEVLEFLGDAVLSLAVTSLLLEEFPEAHEGILSRRRSHLVKRKFLAHLSRELRLEKYLLLGKGELRDGGRKKTSILANTYEALLGAIYLDSGFEPSREIIRRHFRSYLNDETSFPLFHDSKSLLQEQVQQRYHVSPTYQVLETSEPDPGRHFHATVQVSEGVRGEGWGRNKKEAEEEAARGALEALTSVS